MRKEIIFSFIKDNMIPICVLSTFLLVIILEVIGISLDTVLSIYLFGLFLSIKSVSIYKEFKRLLTINTSNYTK